MQIYIEFWKMNLLMVFGFGYAFVLFELCYNIDSITL